MLLGKAMGRLPGGQQLPGHEDPVWLKMGPLGGVAFALDTVINHTRVSTLMQTPHSPLVRHRRKHSCIAATQLDNL